MSKIVDVVLLEKDIIKYSTAYYEGNQLIPDSEFDAMVEDLRKQNPKSEVLTKIGWGYARDEKMKVSHLGSKVGSLDKTKFPEAVDTRDTTIGPKLDGGSIVLNYRDGMLLDALTRGDGSRGMSCTHKMKYVLVGTKVTEKGLISIRGEVIIPNSFHADLVARGIPNPRNYANGIINRIDAGEDIKMLRFIPYSVRIYNKVLGKQEMLELIASWGFKRMPSVPGDSMKNSDDLKALYEKWSKTLPIDGLVITKNSCITASKIEANAFAIDESAIAYKFESERVKVTVGAIDWQAGDTGRIIPVIKLTKPVFLTGANIVSITAHNATQVKEKGIGNGAEITIERANEVIPYLVSVDLSVKADLPDTCPDCGKALEWKGMDLYCYNQHCPTKQFAIIKSMLEICGIPEGFGDKLLKKFIGGETIEQIVSYWAELVKTTTTTSDYQLVPSAHYDKLSFRLKANIWKKFAAGFTYEEFWKMVRIPGLGDSASKKLRKTDPREFSPYSSEEINEVIEKIGNKLNLPSNVMEEMYRTYYSWSKLSKKVPLIAPKATKAITMTVVVTGPVSMPRKEFDKFLADNGVELKDSVSKDVSYLICNDPSNSSKYQKAVKLGVPIVTEDGFMEIIGLE